MNSHNQKGNCKLPSRLFSAARISAVIGLLSTTLGCAMPSPPPAALPCSGFWLLIKEQRPDGSLNKTESAVRLDMTLECRPGARPEIVADDLLIRDGRYLIKWPDDCDNPIIQARGELIISETRYVPATYRFELDDVRCNQIMSLTVHCYERCSR